VKSKVKLWTWILIHGILNVIIDLNMKKKIIYIILVLVCIILLAFAYYAISPLFINIKLDEVVPEMSKEVVNIETKNISAQVIGTVGHPASGSVRIIETEDKNYIRYENFKTINGPDLYVYIAKDLDAKEFIDLGEIKATEGNVNYEIPEYINIGEYQYVMTWCKQFGVLFNYADISNL
jgi:hypothetical protein